nr:putative mitochondrial protein [Quercus suber]
MSSFKIPSKICDNFNATIRRFWWKPKEVDGKFFAWKAWDKLCLPKSKGGLGFKKAKDTNDALLAKLAWLVASKHDSLCMEILRSKYKVQQDWLHKPPPKFSSPIWKAIEGAKSIIVKGACYLMGDEASVNIWQDPRIQGFIPKPKIAPIVQTPLFVTQLIDHVRHKWNIKLVHATFKPESTQAILSIPLPA